VLREAGFAAALRDEALREEALREAGLDAALREEVLRDAGFFAAVLREEVLDEAGFDAVLREEALRDEVLGEAGFFAAVLREEVLREEVLRAAGFFAAVLLAAVLLDAVLRVLRAAPLRDAELRVALAAGVDAPPVPGSRRSISSASDRSSVAVDFAAFCSFLPASSPIPLSVFATCLRSPTACRRLKRSASPFLAMGSPFRVPRRRHPAGALDRVAAFVRRPVTVAAGRRGPNLLKLGPRRCYRRL
jgi:hypothetical protein